MPDNDRPNDSPPNHDLARVVETVEVTPEQHAKFIELITTDRTRGYVGALREAGVAGTRGQLAQHIATDQDLQAEIRDAKGQLVEKLEEIRFEVAFDKTHRDWEKANLTLLARLDPGYRSGGHIELTGANGGPVEVKTEHDYGKLIDKLADIGLLRRPDPDTPHTEEQRLLPAPPD